MVEKLRNNDNERGVSPSQTAWRKKGQSEKRPQTSQPSPPSASPHTDQSSPISKSIPSPQTNRSMPQTNPSIPSPQTNQSTPSHQIIPSTPSQQIEQSTPLVSNSKCQLRNASSVFESDILPPSNISTEPITGETTETDSSISAMNYSEDNINFNNINNAASVLPSSVARQRGGRRRGGRRRLDGVGVTKHDLECNDTKAVRSMSAVYRWTGKSYLEVENRRLAHLWLCV